MRQKIIAGALGAALLSLAAIGAFASQDFVQTNTDPTETATAEATNTQQPEATNTEQPEATETEQPEATETQEPKADAAGERDIKGIPTENPNFHDADTDGVCDHGEAVVKTTTAGTQVRVPCEAADHGDEGHGDGHAPSGDATPEPEESQSD